jgi:transposase-like protein
MSLEIDILRNALISLYGKQGYVRKFAARIGRKPQTVYRWLRGDHPIPVMAMQMATYLMKEKKNDQTRDGGTEGSNI